MPLMLSYFFNYYTIALLYSVNFSFQLYFAHSLSEYSYWTHCSVLFPTLRTPQIAVYLFKYLGTITNPKFNQ